MTGNRQVLADNGYKLATRAEFDAAGDVPEGIREREASIPFGDAAGKGQGLFIVYDPNDDNEGWLLVGDDADELANETVAERIFNE